MSDVMNKNEWITELSAEYKSAENIPVSDIAELAEYVGIEAAIKCYNFFDGNPQYFPKSNILEMKREYVRKCFNDQTPDAVARKLSLHRRTIEKFLNEKMPMPKHSLQIPMFRDSK